MRVRSKRSEKRSFALGLLCGLLLTAAFIAFEVNEQKRLDLALVPYMEDIAATEKLGLRSAIVADYRNADRIWQEHREEFRRAGESILNELAGDDSLGLLPEATGAAFDAAVSTCLLECGAQDLEVDRQACTAVCTLLSVGLVPSGKEYGFCWTTLEIPQGIGYAVYEDETARVQQGNWIAPKTFEGDNYLCLRSMEERGTFFYWYSW